MENCSICNQELKARTKVPPYQKFQIKCEICGVYRVSEEAEEFLKSNDQIQDKKFILSGFIRNNTISNRGTELSTKNIEDIIGSAQIPSDPLEAIDKLILFIHKETKKDTPDRFVPITLNEYPILYCKTPDEFAYYIKKAKELGLIESDTYDGSQDYRLTIPHGWLRASEIKKTEKVSDQVFVAMWFDHSLTEIWEEAFKPALKETGYHRVIRIDKIEHNDRIDDRIIADIRKSSLLVADLTGNRSGVYFEAGFALGLGIPVIWTCRKDFENQIHFDVSHYNTIFWTTSVELKEKLKTRIEGSIPKIK